MIDPMENKHTEGIFDELRALTRRVDRLERTNRALKIVNLAALAAVVAIIRIPSIWALTPGVINALQYNLYSRSGTLLATLGTNTSGFPSLTFFDATGKRLTQVGEADDGKSAGVYGFDGNAILGGKGVERSGFGVGTTGAGMGLSDGNAIERVGTFITADSSVSGLILYDAKSVDRAQVTQDTNPKTNQNVPFYIGLNGTNGASQIFLAQDTSIDNFIGLNDAKGKVRAELFQYAAGNSYGTTAGFAFFDTNGVVRAGISDNASSVDFSLFDATGCTAAHCGVRGFFSEALDDSSTTLGMEDASGVVRLAEGFETSGSYPNDSSFDLYDSKGTPRADIFEQDIPGGFTGLTLLDTNFLTNKINRAGFVEPLDGSNPQIFFNDSTNKSIGSWLPPAAPVP